ncbi:NAD(P)-dependent oxidoreductase [Paenibacillus sp. FSL R7-0216]|uniref:NAD-dependent epimerase/dehydratase family protein n=1 Tax=Paenibacillus sp. FSL R7-0216 TaxID=2921677 RepID=UPI0030DA3991
MEETEKRILITGSNGFVGKHLVSALANKGYTNIFGLHRTPSTEANVFIADLSNKREVTEVVERVNPQIVFHLAANIKPSREIDDLDEMIQSNIGGTMNLLTALKKSNASVDSFVNVGSCEEYGWNEQPFTEDMPPSPVSIYSGTKAASAVLCKMFSNMFNMPIITVRPSLIYGPGQSERFFIMQAIKKMLLNEEFNMTYGMQTRDFIYVDDFVEGLVAVSQLQDHTGQIFNISSGEEHSLRNIAEIIKSATNSSSKLNFGAIPYRESEIMSYRCENSKIVEVTGWRPKTGMEKGIGKIVEDLKGIK